MKQAITTEENLCRIKRWDSFADERKILKNRTFNKILATRILFSAPGQYGRRFDAVQDMSGEPKGLKVEHRPGETLDRPMVLLDGLALPKQNIVFLECTTQGERPKAVSVGPRPSSRDPGKWR